MTVKKIGVVGCGMMGAGIAQVTAQRGFSTIVREVTPELLDKGMDKIRANMVKAVDNEQVTTEKMEQALEHLSGTVRLEDLADCDLVIEAIVEDADEKRELFLSLDDICGENTLFATNTSSLTVTDLAAATGRPDRMLGLHFFNPVPRMKLVEIVRSLQTSEETFRVARDFVERLEKQPIVCKDTSGFVVNRLLVPYLLDAVRALEHNLAGIRDIDTGMELGCGYPMGPLKLLDFVGLDTTVHIANIMFEEFRETRFAPPPLLKKMVRAGMLGRKSGQGFYDYSGTPPEPSEFHV